MAQITPAGPRSDRQPDAETLRAADVPVRLVRGNASAEELSALIAVVAVLTSAGGNDDGGGPGQSDRPSSGSRKYPRSRWSSPARMVRTTHPHGPGGWRASAFPRYRSNRPSGPLHTSG
jgi:hypothetical protein